MSALATKVDSAPASTGRGGKTFTAWSSDDVVRAMTLKTDEEMAIDVVFPKHPTRNYGGVEGGYNAYASAFALAQKAIAAIGDADLAPSDLFEFDVTPSGDGCVVTLVGK